jgi:6-phosphogluconolactonase
MRAAKPPGSIALPLSERVYSGGMRILGILTITTLAATVAGQTIYVGTRTSLGRSQGIYRMTYSPDTGAIRDVKLAAATVDPSFIALHATRPLLYAVAAVPEGKLRAFAIEPDGSLRLLNEVSSKGAGPAHVQVDRSGRWVATANYQSGSMAVYRIETDGRLSEAVDSVQHAGKSVHPKRQTGPHAHSVNFSADNKLLYVADLGIDEVKVYGFNAETGKLTAGEPLRTPAGAGPRHLALGKRRVYVLNELTSTVSVFEQGKLLETVAALPEGFQGTSTAAEIVVDRAEKFLYSSNRGADTIAVFRAGKRLKKIGETKVGRVPRNFVLSPDGRFLLVASQDDDTVQTFRVDAKTGLLSAVGEPVKVPTPICLRFAR